MVYVAFTDLGAPESPSRPEMGAGYELRVVSRGLQISNTRNP